MADIGGHTIRAGMCGEVKPTVEIRNLVGVPLWTTPFPGSTTKSRYIGSELQTLRGICTLKPVMSEGTVINWDYFEQVFHHIFYDELKICPEEHPLLVTLGVRVPKATEEKYLQIFFETFNVPAAQYDYPQILAAYTTLKSHMLAVDVGQDFVSIVPLSDGYAIPSATRKFSLGGSHITSVLATMLSKERGIHLTSPTELEIVAEMKESLSYVAENCETENSSTETFKRYTLPDGQVVSVGHELYR
eukprot:TRINITY_DN5408_c0_g1_i2.p1 TRINITY_DN5408_c0_g1~~TRINITY_DN5408_c0_g1_i2.p1  ORF type:complete len:258 (-),score=10.24 TRINITY_DN5408_c0_g1_i2:437-1174(-)